ncbi:MAG: HAMP domain-containing histidine kinase [Anaerolineales bacterium]|nr:HAMP domain-containing histidine kinase [Anaerolineales bacterium]
MKKCNKKSAPRFFRPPPFFKAKFQKQFRQHSPWEWSEHTFPHHAFPLRRKHKPGSLFVRLAAVFGVMGLLVMGTMAVASLFISRLFAGDMRIAPMIWLAGCALSLVLPMLAAGLGTIAYRNFVMPLSDLMSTADSVAGGDLSARVNPRRGKSEFDQFTRSFNHMIEELERSDQQRRNLTADVAHELRTPIHIIQGNLEGILDGVYEPAPDHIQATLEETRALSRLVDDLHTLSIADTGKLNVNLEQVDVREILSDACTSFSGQAQVAGIELVMNAPGDSGYTIMADIGRLDQILSNLLTNAFRHTPQGGTITLSAEPIKEGVRIVVQDTGEGIPPQDLPYIFDRFWRGDRSRARIDGAHSGLGLAIVKKLVEIHQGTIVVDSHPGQGTLFTINLPTSPSAFSTKIPA